MLKYNFKSKQVIALISSSLLLLGTSCKENKQYYPDVEVVELTSDLTMDELSDSTFFSIVNCMVEYNGDIYASLAKRLHIVRMDKDLKLRNTMGGVGRGPGEFQTLNTFFVGDSIVWAGDAAIFAIRKFSLDGKYLGVEERTESRYTLSHHYWMEDNVFYFWKSNLDRGTSLAVLDLNKPEGENDYREFGEFTDFGGLTKNQYQNERDVLYIKTT